MKKIRKKKTGEKQKERKESKKRKRRDRKGKKAIYEKNINAKKECKNSRRK